MKRAPSNRPLESLVGLGATALAGIPFLMNLSSGSLWQDEAQTALIARTILTHGVPMGSDGLNFFSQELGAEYGPGLVWRWHTWFPFYLLAGFFALFGESTFQSRLPFALFGVATVFAAQRLARDLLQSQRGGVAAGFLLASSVPFLILSRQCRYYSIAAFSSVLALLAYRRLIDRDGARKGFLLLAALVLSFHTHYLYYATLVGAILLDCLVFHRRELPGVAKVCITSAILNLPWIAWLSTMPYGDRYSILDLSRAYEISASLLRPIESEVVPAAVLIVPILLLIWRKSEGSGPAMDRSIGAAMTPLVSFTVLTIAAISFSAPDAFFRYLAPIVPVLCILMSWIVDAAARRHWVAGLAVLVGIVSIQPLRAFSRELTREFEGPIDGIVRHLREHADPRDLVAVTYEDLPIKFYTSLRVVGGLTGEDLSPALRADWVVIRKYSVSSKDRAVRQFLLERLPWERYERVVLEVPDTKFQNRESPFDHRFETAQDEDPVVLYRRIEPGWMLPES